MKVILKKLTLVQKECICLTHLKIIMKFRTEKNLTSNILSLLKNAISTEKLTKKHTIHTMTLSTIDPCILST